ncbi:MAG: hypothetical protein P1V81_17205 [Planctomycetota bacterium]|nr:hypothetical protein [Planctomycetota bacterium]
MDRAVGSVLAGARLDVSFPGGALEVCIQGQRYLVEVRSLRHRPVSEILQGALADSVLRIHQRIERSPGPKREPMVVLAVRDISLGMVQMLQDYASDFAPGVALGIVDARGWAEVRSAAGEVLLSLEPSEREASPLAALLGPSALARRQAPGGGIPSGSAFSDLGQWLIKVLLGERIERDLMAVPRVSILGRPRRGARYQGVRELAKAAAISPGSVSRLLAALDRGGWLDPAGIPPRLVRVGSLLSAWAGAARGPARIFQASFLLPVGDPEDQLLEAIRLPHPDEAVPDLEQLHGRRALAGISACSMHRLRVVRSAPPQLYMESPSQAGLEQLGLRAPVMSRSGSRDSPSLSSAGGSCATASRSQTSCSAGSTCAIIPQEARSKPRRS